MVLTYISYDKYTKDQTQSPVNSMASLLIASTIKELSQRKWKEENNTWEAEYKPLDLSKRAYCKLLSFSKNFDVFTEGDGFPL